MLHCLMSAFYPKLGSQFTAALHCTWKGIVYLWGRGGAFERNEKPESRSNNLDERLAFRLTQDAIEKKKSDISRHLIEV